MRPRSTTTASPASVPAPDERVARPRLVPLPEGWPLVALLGFFPLWWVLGMGQFIWPVLAVPMAMALARRGRVRLPPFFALWLLLLVWMLVGSLALGVEIPGTVSASAAHRLPAFTFHLAQFVAATITLLYVGNLTEAEFSRRRVVRLLGIFFLFALAGGLLGLLWPGLNFTTPVETLLMKVFAHGDWNAGFITDLAHPHAADVQDVLGYTTSRPTAPFPYTNMWGVVISITMLWFVVWLWPPATVTRRLALVAGLILFAIVIVASLDRGVWIGILGVIVYVGGRSITTRRAAAIGVLLALFVGIVMVSPLYDTIRLRLDHPHSNAGRLEQAVAAIHGAYGSPVVGYGSTRTLVGNTISIAAGATADCPLCGGIAIGSAGELWLILFAHGFVGATLFVGYLVSSLWVFRRDRTAIGTAARLTLMLSLLYILFYGSAGPPLTLTFLAIALLWRNQARPLR